MRITAYTRIIVIIASLLLPVTLIADKNTGSITLTANPPSIAADGKSFTTITAKVRDKDGRFAPDETEIRFTSSLGEIEETGTVRGGSARVKLTSATITGTSTVTATWVDGQAVARVTVEFGERQALPTGPEYIDVQASDYLAYSVDHQTLEAIGNVRLRYRALELEAHSVQVDLAKSKIVAKGEGRTDPVKLLSKSGVTEASLFACDFFGSQGVILSAERGKIQQVSITGSGWTLGPEQALFMRDQFDFQDLSDSGILVKAKQATLFPGEKIQFRRANVYVDGKRMLSLPFYVLSLTGYQPDGEQYVGYGTGGMTLNLPFYYALSPKSSGAALVRYGLSNGWGQSSWTPGWFVDLRQKYKTSASDGIFTLTNVTDAWGAQFTHSQRFLKDGNAYLYLDYPAHKSMFGSLNINKPIGALNVGLNLSGSNYSTTVLDPDGQVDSKTQDTLKTSDVFVQTKAFDLSKVFKYSLSARADQSVRDITTDKQGTRTVTTVTSSTQRLDGNLYTVPIKLTRTLSLRGSSSLGYLFGDPDLSGASVLSNAIMDWKMDNHNSLQLSYRYSSRPTYRYVDPDPYDGVFEQVRIRDRDGSQALSASLRLGDGNRWWGNIYALKGLNYGTSNIFTDFSYRLSPEWRFTIRTTANRYSYQRLVITPNPLDPQHPGISYVPTVQTFSDLELGIGKLFGSRELRAVWSRRDGRVMLELGSGGF